MKKIFTILLVIILLLVPFGLVLNVMADPLEIRVYDNISKSIDEPDAKLIRNTTNIIIKNIGYNSNENTYDQLKAYKILNSYYNSNTREISYDYTDDFKAFLTESRPELVDNIGRYFSLSGDSTNYTEYGSYSELNSLVSDYAIYISGHNISETASMTSTTVNGEYEAVLNTEVGVYLILASSLCDGYLTGTDFNNETAIKNALAINSYGVIVANAVIGVADGEWVLSDVEMIAKKRTQGNILGFSRYTSEELQYEDGLTAEEFWEIAYKSVDLRNEINVVNGETFNYTAVTMIEHPLYPNDDIEDYDMITEELNTMDIEFPEGIDYELFLWIEGLSIPTEMVNGEIFAIIPVVGREKVATITTEGNTLHLKSVSNGSGFGFQFDLTANDNISVGSNVVRLTSRYLKDPYYDIDTVVSAAVANGMTEEEAVESIMDDIVGVSVVESTINTYGIRVTNTSSDQTIGDLVGAEFIVCKDNNCAEQVGSSFTITRDATTNQVYGTFIGVDGEHDYYLKQTKAPNGHNLFTTPIKLLAINSETTPDSTNIGVSQNNYYEVPIVNEKSGLLPFTGGSGTVLYTIIGLFIVILSFIIYMEIKKNRVTVNNNNVI